MVDLEALGVPGVPVLGYTRSISYGWAVEEHAHVGCIEVGLCLRGALVLENQAIRHSLMPGDLFVNRIGLVGAHHAFAGVLLKPVARTA